MTSTVFAAFVVAAVLIVALAFYAGSLLWRVQQQSKAAQLELAEKRQYLRDSIILICKAMLAEQCELSEGALRVWVLLDHLAPEHKLDPITSYPGLYQMYQVVKDMPTHKARKAQDKALTQQQDVLRLKAEQDLKPLILIDADTLLKRFQPA